VGKKRLGAVKRALGLGYDRLVTMSRAGRGGGRAAAKTVVKRANGWTKASPVTTGATVRVIDPVFLE